MWPWSCPASETRSRGGSSSKWVIRAMLDEQPYVRSPDAPAPTGNPNAFGRSRAAAPALPRPLVGGLCRLGDPLDYRDHGADPPEGTCARSGPAGATHPWM